MRRNLIAGALLLGVFSGFSWFKQHPHTLRTWSAESEEEGKKPYDEDMLQRMYGGDLAGGVAAYNQTLKAAHQQMQNARTSGSDIAGNWLLEGPINISGRINAIAIHPTNPNIIYVGAAQGGVFKTTDGGANWIPIFDDNPYLSIGHIAFDPSNANTIYVGTGDINISGNVYTGDGVYKSTDAGATWQHLGLDETKVISRVIVHPNDPNTLFVGAMGNPFERNNDRGFYKSTNGGASWTKTLFVSNQAGVMDVIIHPTNPNILYATSFDRIRTFSESITGGNNTKVWKSIDGGDTWTALSNGLPSGPMGRIGLAISHQDPNKVYAMYADMPGSANGSAFYGVFKTTNGGTSWAQIGTSTLDPNLMSNFAWYFGQIRVNPSNDNEIYLGGVWMMKSDDGGDTWYYPDGSWYMHADNHDQKFFNNGQSVLAATDGGMYRSDDGGLTFYDVENLPITQFYRVEKDPFSVNDYYGGAQDNGTLVGNSGNISSWYEVFGGDGFQARFDPTNTNIWYVEYQNLGLNYTTDDGMSFNDHTTGIDGSQQRNWDGVYILSKNNPNIQYTATDRIYKNTSGPGGVWNEVSPNLTDSATYVKPMFHTVSVVRESPANVAILWAGTSDGNVWKSTNSGTSWVKISGLPDRYVTDIMCHPTQAGTAWVSVTGYRDNENIPYLYRTDDYGSSWTSVSGDLPPLGINKILIYPTNPQILFVATDGGVHVSKNGGLNWQRIGDNMPLQVIRDITFDLPNMRLVAATYARSIQSFDLNQILTPTAIPTQTAVEINISPNPVQDILAVSTPNLVSFSKMEIIDIQGKVVKTFQNTTNVADLQAGIYFVRISSGKETYVRKWVKL